MSTVSRLLARRDLWLVAVGLLTVTVTAAAVTRLAFAPQARGLLAVQFTAIPDTAGQAFAIWLHNARATVGVAVFAVARPVSGWLLQGARPVWDRVIVAVCDVLVGAWAVGSSTAAGVMLGAYGTRQLRSFLPDGPVEVTAWLLLVLLYLDVRRGRATVRGAAVRLAVILVVLGVAAVLELRAGG